MLNDAMDGPVSLDSVPVTPANTAHVSQTCTGDVSAWLSARRYGWGWGKQQRKINPRYSSSTPGRQQAYCKYNTRGQYQNRIDLESCAGSRVGEMSLAGASVAAEVEMDENAEKDQGHFGRRD